MHCGREAGDLSSLRRAPPRAKERSFRRGREGAAPTNSITKPADADMERTEVAGRYGIQNPMRAERMIAQVAGRWRKWTQGATDPSAFYDARLLSRFLASCRSTVSKPSVNQS